MLYIRRKYREGEKVFYVEVSGTNISLGAGMLVANIPYLYHILISVGFVTVKGLRKCS
jgi:hypothetical protein